MADESQTPPPPPRNQIFSQNRHKPDTEHISSATCYSGLRSISYKQRNYILPTDIVTSYKVGNSVLHLGTINPFVAILLVCDFDKSRVVHSSQHSTVVTRRTKNGVRRSRVRSMTQRFLGIVN
jgi:hypothetical protein